MTKAALVFPHQLYAESPALEGVKKVVLIEDPLFFRQYGFHRQKLLFHRVSMQRYADRLRRQGLSPVILPSDSLPQSSSLGPELSRLGIRSVQYVDPSDDWLGTRLEDTLNKAKIKAQRLEDDHFLTPLATIRDYAAEKKKLFFTDFYMLQRKRLGILVDSEGKPEGGKWSFDTDNRKKLPKNVVIPKLPRISEDDLTKVARASIHKDFPSAPGEDAPFPYPTDHEGARAWLHAFVEDRLPFFGNYEDSIHSGEDVLFHSMLTPMLNVGLLSPDEVVDAVLKRQSSVPLNSLEGFIRQVIGWREFVRLVYLTRGRQQRTRNYWEFKHPMPRACYDGTTGILPIDTVIHRVLRLGYCHHIERLMILGNFFLLCDIHPDAVYRWFMELFIDAYDWVMVPNVYGMSQHADGGLMTTKPYISGSSYVLKMSNFVRGDWCAIWDALYWRFIDRHSAFFASNPRMAVMVKMKDKLGPRLREHLRKAEAFLDQLHR